MPIMTVIRNTTGLFVVAAMLAACGTEARECAVSTADAWAADKSQVYFGIRSENSQSFGHEFVFAHKGDALDGQRCGREKMVWCKAPHQEESCQLFVCSGTTRSASIFQITEGGQAFHYTAPQQTEVTWDGEKMRCRSAS